MSKASYIPKLINLFRQFGYEGVTLSKISQETGLGKASLYHHFPGGKAEMAEAAITQVDEWLEANILPVLVNAANGKAKPIEAFETMCEETNQFFNGGQNSCLWAVLSLEKSSADLFEDRIKLAFEVWIEAIASVLIAAGMARTLARERAENAVITIQGALIVSRSLKDLTVFERIIRQLPQQLCQGVEK